MDEHESRQALLNMQMDVYEGKQYQLSQSSVLKIYKKEVEQTMANQFKEAGWISLSKSGNALNIQLDEPKRFFTVPVDRIKKVLAKDIKATKYSEVISEAPSE